MKAYKLMDDCDILGYFKTKEDIVKYMINNEDISQWFDNYDDYNNLIRLYKDNKITWNDFIKKCMENCIYINEIEIIGE